MSNVQYLKTIYTESEVDEAVADWKAALTDVSEGQSYNMKGRQLTMVDTPEIRKTLEWWGELKASYSDENIEKTSPQSNVGRPDRS